jgi:hypothetical protein
MRGDALSLYRTLHGGLEEKHLRPWLGQDDGRHALLRLVATHPGIANWLRFKAVLVEHLLARYRTTLDEAGGGRVRFVPQAFPPPWSLVSGFDFSRVAKHCHAIPVKLYTMHWPMMLRFYGDALRAANPGLDERLLGRCLLRWLDVQDADVPTSIESFAYPEPEQRHPVGAAAQLRKIAQAQTEAGDTPVLAIAHGYGLLRDFEIRARIAWQASGRRIWVNRYGYLSDAKLDALGALPRA